MNDLDIEIIELNRGGHSALARLNMGLENYGRNRYANAVL